MSCVQAVLDEFVPLCTNIVEGGLNCQLCKSTRAALEMATLRLQAQ